MELFDFEIFLIDINFISKRLSTGNSGEKKLPERVSDNTQKKGGEGRKVRTFNLLNMCTNTGTPWHEEHREGLGPEWLPTRMGLEAHSCML